MNRILVVEPPLNCWAKGYPVVKGKNKNSVNKTTVYAQNNNIVANQQRLKNSFCQLKDALGEIMWSIVCPIKASYCKAQDF